MLASLRRNLEAIPEHRTGCNVRYRLVDAGLGAFAVFFLQSPSFLAYQQKMREHHGRDNAKSLFGMEEIPSDGQIRNLLDPIEPQLLTGLTHLPIEQRQLCPSPVVAVACRRSSHRAASGL